MADTMLKDGDDAAGAVAPARPRASPRRSNLKNRQRPSDPGGAHRMLTKWGERMIL